MSSSSSQSSSSGPWPTVTVYIHYGGISNQSDSDMVVPGDTLKYYSPGYDGPYDIPWNGPTEEWVVMGSNGVGNGVAWDYFNPAGYHFVAWASNSVAKETYDGPASHESLRMHDSVTGQTYNANTYQIIAEGFTKCDGNYGTGTPTFAQYFLVHPRATPAVSDWTKFQDDDGLGGTGCVFGRDDYTTLPTVDIPLTTDCSNC